MPIPTLLTDRLRLVPPSAEHLDHYVSFFSDADESASYGGPLTPGQSWARLAHDRGVWELREFGVWILTTSHDDRVIGGCGFWQGHGWPHELTWWLESSARGSGFAYEASVAVINRAYVDWGWPVVQTYMTDDNTPARALALRLGGVALRRVAFPDGNERTIFGLPRPDGTLPTEPEL